MNSLWNNIDTQSILNNLIQHITCPYTGLIMKDPVTVLSTGVTCESKSAIKKYDSDDIIANTNVKNIIDLVLEKNQLLQQQQFGNKLPHYLFKKEFEKDLRSVDDNVLYKYVNIDLLRKCQNVPEENVITYICNIRSLDVIEYCINNAVNINAKDDNGLKVIDYICRLGNYDALKILLNKFGPHKLHLNGEDNIGETLLTYMQIHSTSESKKEIIKLLIEWGANINLVNRNGINVIHDTVTKGDFVMFELYVNTGSVNLGLISPQVSSRRLINYILKNSVSSEIIELTIEKISNELYKEDDNVMKDLLKNTNIDSKAKDRLNYIYLKKLDSLGLVSGPTMDS